MDKKQIKYKVILISIVISLLALTGFELLISKPLIYKKYPSLKYIEFSQLPGLEFKSECCNYQLIDPLLGWALTDKQIKEKGYMVKNNCIYLNSFNNPDSQDTLRIYLSGGSTTDVGYNAKNWPVILLDSLKKQSINVELYIAAVSGYSTSQEFLKFMRDGIHIKPDIVISYNGANEILYPSYVSIFEYAFYSRALFAEQSAIVLPNTIFLLKEALEINQPIDLKSLSDSTEYVAQWEKNMISWNAISTVYGSKFLGILQPVMNSNFRPTEEETKNYRYLFEQYPNFYKDAIDITTKHDFLVNEYNLLDSVGKNVFHDHCHIKDEYQYIVANSILKLILKSSSTLEI